MKKGVEQDFLVYSEIGRRIQLRRQKISLTQEALAEKIGVTGQHISNVENGKTKLSVPRLAYVAQALDCSVDYLLGSQACENTAKYNVRDELDQLLQDATSEQHELFIRLCRAVKPWDVNK